MSDPLKTVVPAPADALTGAERDARVERLLLQGLDYYFGGDYDTAVHVWTRVLFLDRGHARARAYIERARSAQAERQRESEELLHRGVAAFDRGDTGDARELLTAAVSQGTEPEVALSYLGRLDRLEVTRTPTQASGEARGPSRPAQRPPTHRSRVGGTRTPGDSRAASDCHHRVCERGRSLGRRSLFGSGGPASRVRSDATGRRASAGA